MKKRSFDKSIPKCFAAYLRSIDYNSLQLSDYNIRYINRMLPVMEYYMDIYYRCLTEGIISTGMDAKDITLIDYGGGSGFLSLFAKRLGIGRVIYIDINPLSVETISILKAFIGMGPDEILTGSSDVLADWCLASRIEPQLLLATDLIEHIYNLSDLFGDLNKINKKMELIFTTGSNPYNPIVRKRLQRFMQDCESGAIVSPNYYTRRKNFIRQNYPDLTNEQVDAWSNATRGLTYDDILRAIGMNYLPTPDDKYNTCDPETGNWAERILSIDQYKEMLEPFNYNLYVRKGFYNTHRSNPLVTLVCKCLNMMIRYTGRMGLYISPFIILHGKKR